MDAAIYCRLTERMLLYVLAPGLGYDDRQMRCIAVSAQCMMLIAFISPAG